MMIKLKVWLKMLDVDWNRMKKKSF